MSEPGGPAPRPPLAGLRQLARQARENSPLDEQCDLCGEPVPPGHRHLLDVPTRQVLCACRACTILFDHSGAGSGVRRLIPTRVRALPDFALPDPLWEGLRLPVNLAFFTRSSAANRVLAFYPSPMGPTESLLDLAAWEDLERRNPILRELEPDVEALLANRVRGARVYYLAPIDSCYELVGIIRASWRGFSGGHEVWKAIDRHFAGLQVRAKPARGPHA